MAFTVAVDSAQLYPIITLSDTTGRTQVEVYTFGALLNKFTKLHHREVFNVVDGFNSVEDAVQYITPSFKGAKLSPFVCRIANATYRFAEEEYRLTKYSMNGSALHGLVFDQVFTITQQEAGEHAALVVLEFNYDKKDEGFPFAFKCSVRYTLEANSSLTLHTTIENVGKGLLPVADGWHPYFTLGSKVDACQLEFQSKEKLVFDEHLLPNGELLPYQEYGSLETIGDAAFDNCFTVNFAECQPLAVFRNPQNRLQVEVYPSAAYPYLQLFIPPHRNSIAIENLSAYPDALNNFTGLQVLQPKQTAEFSTRYAISSI